MGAFYYLLRGGFNDGMILSLVLFLAAWSWLLWRRAGGFVLWLALMLAQGVTVFFSARSSRAALILTAASVLIPPTLVYVVGRRLRWPRRLVFAVFFVSLCANLWLYARSSDFLYLQPSPAAWGVDTKVQPPLWPQSRGVDPPEWYTAPYDGIMSYPEFVQRQAYIFSPATKTRELAAVRPAFKEMSRRYFSLIRANLPGTILNDFFILEKHREIIENTAARAPGRAFGEEEDFSTALKSPRLGAMLMPRRTFTLIHSNMPAPILRKLFAAGAPLFQFKRGVIDVPDAQLSTFFRKLDAKDAASVADCYAVLGDPPTGAWSRWSVPTSQAAARARTCRPARFTYATIGGINDFDVDYSASEEGVLFWSDGYDSRWKAFVDGRPAPIARAGMAFKALIIPGGQHRLHFSYDPVDFKFGLASYYGALAACLILAMGSYWVERRGRKRLA